MGCSGLPGMYSASMSVRDSNQFAIWGPKSARFSWNHFLTDQWKWLFFLPLPFSPCKHARAWQGISLVYTLFISFLHFLVKTAICRTKSLLKNMACILQNKSAILVSTPEAFLGTTWAPHLHLLEAANRWYQFNSIVVTEPMKLVISRAGLP